mgnify:CR=1 FL=1
MKQKLIIAGSVLLLIVVVLLMARDMFQNPTTSETNPYEYKLDNFKDIDSSLFCYSEVKRFNPIIEKLNGIAIDQDDNLYLTGIRECLFSSLTVCVILDCVSLYFCLNSLLFLLLSYLF